MYTSNDYLNYDLLNDIENDMNYIINNKYASILSTKYVKKTWKKNELVYVEDVKNIEDSLEILGEGLGYPNGWIKGRKWNLNEHNNISYIDINRWINNIDILYSNNYNPLIPSSNLKPSNNLKPTNERRIG